LAVPPAIVAASCSTGAVGTAACTTVEDYRCTIAPLCTPGFDVDACQRFYRDACLNGIQNTTLTVNPSTLAPACVSALGVVAASAADGGANSPYPLADLVPDASCAALTTLDPTACDLILDCPELLPACNFVASPPDAGTDADAATEDADAATADADAAAEDAADMDAGDAGDAAGE
jgi:hypothetical protein